MAIAAVERIDKAVRLEKPDRVPYVPIIDLFATRYGGICQHDLLYDVRKADMALENTLKNLGPVDGQNMSYAGLGRFLRFLTPNIPRVPGIDGVPRDEPWQFMEHSVMEPHEYREMAEQGVFPWLLGKLRINHPNLRTAGGFVRECANLGSDNRSIARSVKRWHKRGVETLVASNFTFTPMEYISVHLRGFKDFTLDMYRCPEEIKIASRAMIPSMKIAGLVPMPLNRIKRVFFGGARTGPAFMSPEQFEQLALPEWRELVEFYSRLGITSILHLDGDWTTFLPYFVDFPPRRCIMNLDGATDIRLAKELLGERMCIMGDVPATLLKLGDPDEVDEYCRALIEDVGQDGGFILSSGCSIPVDAKPANVAAVSRAVQRYGWYR
ncbi:MAG: uroporphyrinogen decarboxylase family protein [Candidatus Geothermincolia bacterium]